MANPYQGDDVDYFEAARDEEGNIKREAPDKKPEPKKQSFGAAFAEARAGGKKTFEYPPGSGKKYTTRTKEDDEKDARKSEARKSEAPKRKPVSTAGDIASKNAEQLSGLMNAATKKVPARPPVSTAGAIASRNFKSGGMVKSSASKRADGCATKGKTKGRMV